ncbi:MAG: hypothetical protein GF320_00580 [Armatimonadia bacterium]|nr:hypothetical protein [Armatimonadia bacterium]
MEIGIPPLPSWAGAHPLIVHLPLGALAVVPLLIILGLIVPQCGRAFWWSALALMAVGTVGAWVAVESGHAAWEVALKSGEAGEVLERHEELAELTRNAFTVLTGLYAAMLLGPVVAKKELSWKANWGMQVPFLVLYAAGLLILANTGHEGARAVHEFSVLSIM